MSAFPSYDKLLAELRYEATWANLMAKFNAFETEVLGLKYSPDQPRAPKGTHEGGQWIVDPNSARQRQNERIHLASGGYSIGKLVAQYPLSGGIICVYKFDFGLIAAPGSILGCQSIVPSASVQHGQMLNDN